MDRPLFYAFEVALKRVSIQLNSTQHIGWSQCILTEVFAQFHNETFFAGQRTSTICWFPKSQRIVTRYENHKGESRVINPESCPICAHSTASVKPEVKNCRWHQVNMETCCYTGWRDALWIWSFEFLQRLGGQKQIFLFFFCGFVVYPQQYPSIVRLFLIILGEYFRPETLKPLHVGPNFPLLRPKFPSFSSHVKICQWIAHLSQHVPRIARSCVSFENLLYLDPSKFIELNLHLFVFLCGFSASHS